MAWNSGTLFFGWEAANNWYDTLYDLQIYLFNNSWAEAAAGAVHHFKILFRVWKIGGGHVQLQMSSTVSNIWNSTKSIQKERHTQDERDMDGKKGAGNGGRGAEMLRCTCDKFLCAMLSSKSGKNSWAGLSLSLVQLSFQLRWTAILQFVYQTGSPEGWLGTKNWIAHSAGSRLQIVAVTQNEETFCTVDIWVWGFAFFFPRFSYVFLFCWSASRQLPKCISLRLSVSCLLDTPTMPHYPTPTPPSRHLLSFLPQHGVGYKFKPGVVLIFWVFKAPHSHVLFVLTTPPDRILSSGPVQIPSPIRIPTCPGYVAPGSNVCTRFSWGLNG